MGWASLLPENQNQQDTSQQDTRFLRFDNPERVGQQVEVRLRVLDEDPVKSIRHWIDNRPVNCAAKPEATYAQRVRQCPACLARDQAQKAGDPNWRELYRRENKYLVNVAVNGEVKIWSFGSKLGGRIALYTGREDLGDPRGYDLTVVKRRTGPNKMNVEYELFPEKKTGILKEHKALLEQRHDLSGEIAPSEPETVKSAIEDAKAISMNGSKPGASILQTAELQRLATEKGYTLEGLGIHVLDLTAELADQYIADLKSAK